ncbi:unnamed protein product [Calypogeia fissa]
MVEEDSRGGGGGREGGGGAVDACPICLEPMSGEAFLDQCFHRFCFHCILQWSEMLIAKPQSTSSRLQCLKCPLCKTHYTSIIHDLSGAKFQRHYILTSEGNRYQRLDGHIQRQAVYASEVEQKLARFTNVVPKPNRWLSIWVKRELQALMQEEDVETVMQHVVGVVEAFNKRFGGKSRISTKGGAVSKDLDWHTTVSTAVQPFIFEHAQKFAEELGSFLLSELEIEAYDRQNQLRASVAGHLSRINDSNLQDSSNARKNMFDLYDEDVDADGDVEVMVGRGIEADSLSFLSEQIDPTRSSPVIKDRSSSAEYPLRGETPQNLEQRNHVEEEALSENHRYSQREITEEKHKKRVSSSDYRNEGSHSNSGHNRGKSKSRKRSRYSPSSPSGEI